MMHPARWSFTLLVAATYAAIVALLAAASWMLMGLLFEGDLDIHGLTRVLPTVLVIMFVLTVVKLKSPKLLILPDRLIVHRSGVQITMLVADFDAVGRQPGMPLPTEMLEFRVGTIEPELGKPSNRFLERALRKKQADRTIMPGQFFADWRSSELGAVLPGVRAQ